MKNTGIRDRLKFIFRKKNVCNYRLILYKDINGTLPKPVPLLHKASAGNGIGSINCGVQR